MTAVSQTNSTTSRAEAYLHRAPNNAAPQRWVQGVWVNRNDLSINKSRPLWGWRIQSVSSVYRWPTRTHLMTFTFDSVWFHELRPHPRLDLTVTDRETGIEKTIWGRPSLPMARQVSVQTCCLPARQSPDLPQLCCNIFLLLLDSASLPLCVTTESIFGCTALPF